MALLSVGSARFLEAPIAAPARSQKPYATPFLAFCARSTDTLLWHRYNRMLKSPRTTLGNA